MMGIFLFVCLVAYLYHLALDWWDGIKYDEALHRAQSWRPPTCTCIPNALTDNPNCPDHGDK